VPADIGTIALLDDTKLPRLRIVKVSWAAGAGGAFEKNLPVAVHGRLVQIAHKPGAVNPTAASDLAVFDERDTAQEGAIVTAAADGLDLVTTTYKSKAMTVPAPYVAGVVRLQVNANSVATAVGTFWLFIEEMRRAL